MTENDAAIQQARRELEAAWEAAGEAWGACDGQHAKPQAVQLRNRIVLGKFYIKHNPDPALKRHLLHLKAQYSEAVEDSKDQELCRAWWAAYTEFRQKEKTYLDLVRAGGGGT